MANRLKPRSSRAVARRKARILASLGDKLIHHIRSEKPLTIWTTTAPSTGYDMDMGVWTPSPGETIAAYFTDANTQRRIPVRLQMSNEQVVDSGLELSLIHI